MTIHLEYPDGRKLAMSPEAFLAMFLQFLEVLEPSPVQPARCPACQFGRIGLDYCTCQLGRDLKRIETKVPNPVGGMDEGASNHA